MATTAIGQDPVLCVTQEQAAPLQNIAFKKEVFLDVLHYITLIALIAIAALAIAEILPATEAGIAMVTLSAVLLVVNGCLTWKENSLERKGTACIRTTALIAALVVGALVVSGGLSVVSGGIGVLVPVGLAFVVKAVSDKKYGSPLKDALGGLYTRRPQMKVV